MKEGLEITAHIKVGDLNLKRSYFSTDGETLAKIEAYRWGKSRWDRSEDKSRNAALKELLLLGIEAAAKARQP